MPPTRVWLACAHFGQTCKHGTGDLPQELAKEEDAKKPPARPTPSKADAALTMLAAISAESVPGMLWVAGDQHLDHDIKTCMLTTSPTHHQTSSPLAHAPSMGAHASLLHRPDVCLGLARALHALGYIRNRNAPPIHPSRRDTPTRNTPSTHTCVHKRHPPLCAPSRYPRPPAPCTLPAVRGTTPRHAPSRPLHGHPHPHPHSSAPAGTAFVLHPNGSLSPASNPKSVSACTRPTCPTSCRQVQV